MASRPIWTRLTPFHSMLRNAGQAEGVPMLHSQSARRNPRSSHFHVEHLEQASR